VAVPLQMQLNWPQVSVDGIAALANVSVVPNDAGRMWGFGASWQIQWLTSFWPLNANRVWRRAATALCQRVNALGFVARAELYLPSAAAGAGRPWSELAYLVCWIALASKDASSRGMGIDCLIGD